MSQPITALFGITLPIVQAPMAGVQVSALAIAVSEAGALGSLPAAMLTPQALQRELQALRAGTSRPFNVNFFAHTPPADDAARQARWLAALAGYFDELGLDAAAVPAGAARQPFNAAICDLVEPLAPPVVSFHFGLPDAALVARVKRWGAKILSSATTVEEARWLVQHGADAVIAQGLEAGGHRGHFLSDDLTRQLGTFALLPQVVAAIGSQVPVIAAGGIADAQAVAAALTLGAAGVQVGTSYLLCDEATTTPLHRAALQALAAQASGDARHGVDASMATAITNCLTGRPARGIVNRLMREQGPISPDAPSFPLAANAVGVLRAEAEKRGSTDFTPLWSGQNATGCRTVSAAEMTRALAQGVPAALRSS